MSGNSSFFVNSPLNVFRVISAMLFLCYSLLLICRFDILANGGASLTLSFERAPFLTQFRTVWIPWNVFYVMDTLVMKKEENDIPSCDLSGFIRPSPLIVATPLSTFFRSSPENGPIIPETQVKRAFFLFEKA